MEISIEEYKSRLTEVFLLDVRDEHEYEIYNIGGHLIPLPELSNRIHEIPRWQEIVTVCKMGARGKKAAAFLTQRGFHVSNLQGGLHAWAKGK